MRTRKHCGQHDLDTCGPCRWQTVAIDPRSMPTREQPLPKTQEGIDRMNERSRNSCAWERGIAIARTNTDGSQMPLINSKGHAVGVKTYAENRRRIEASRAAVQATPHILTSTGGS